VSTPLLIRALRDDDAAAIVTAISPRPTRCSAAGCCHDIPPGRSDRRFCSNACRQRQYRKRLGAA
jgi:hypothetical protein